MTEQTAPTVEKAQTIPALLAAHRYRDVLGDYEIAPFYKHFGCSCGWEQNIAGMSGWQSWLAAHEAHVASEMAPLLANLLASARADILREHADREVAHEGYTMAVERLLAHAHEHDGHLLTLPEQSPS